MGQLSFLCVCHDIAGFSCISLSGSSGTDHKMLYIVSQNYTYPASSALLVLFSEFWLHLCGLTKVSYELRLPTALAQCNRHYILHSTTLVAFGFQYKIRFFITNCGLPSTDGLSANSQ